MSAHLDNLHFECSADATCSRAVNPCGLESRYKLTFASLLSWPSLVCAQSWVWSAARWLLSVWLTLARALSSPHPPHSVPPFLCPPSRPATRHKQKVPRGSRHTCISDTPNVGKDFSPPLASRTSALASDWLSTIFLASYWPATKTPTQSMAAIGR